MISGNVGAENGADSATAALAMAALGSLAWGSRSGAAAGALRCALSSVALFRALETLLMIEILSPAEHSR
jgi:hypothetical protein